MSDPIDREVAAFGTARQLPAAARAAYLDEACAGDAALRLRVEELLRASEDAGAFLQEPAPGARRAGDALASPSSPPNAATPGEKVGDRIGRYKLLQQIGEGGCGIVYMAEQEEPVRRRVALKVIKLGMDTKQVVARFEAERQALALMDHPNIAKVLEAGATAAGRPYFVMELVRGIKITDYCDENNLSTEERLDLFIKAAQAVQHAHQKGIIHRDIKPSNILVADHDGEPVPKIIDFGIAKATTDQRLTDKTLFTAFEQFIGTPAYMSTEQARMSGLDIDTRTDIYSLGVLLYELLTGKTPFDTQALLAAGLDEMRRTISEQEPARPSTRLSTMVEGELTTAAKHRRTDAPKLVHLLRGDLDWIVMKALEKDRARRYDTANGLAMDIQRYLADEAVVARPPGNLYRFQKLVRRNKLAFAAIGAVAAALMIGLAVSTWLLLKETEARQRAVAAEKKARTEAVKSQQVAVFLKKMLQGTGPSKALGRDTAMLREILDETARTVGQELSNQPEVAIELCLILAETYHDLGLYKEMEGVARQSLHLARSKLGEENESVAVSLTSLGDALQHLGEMHVGSLEEAEKYSRAGLAMSKKLLGNEHFKVANALHHLANVLSAQSRFAESEPMQREALAMYRKLIGNECPEVAKSLSDLALLLLNVNRLAEAESANREALAMQRKLLGDQHPEVAKSLRVRATVLMYQGRPGEAETTFRDSLARWGKLQANDRPELALLPQVLASVLTQQDKLPEAEARYRDALGMYKRLYGDYHPDVAWSLDSLAYVLQRQGKPAEAETIYRQALEVEGKLPPGKHPDGSVAIHGLAEVLKSQGRSSEVVSMYREALVIQKKRFGNEHVIVASTLEQLANALEDQGDLSEAEDLLRQSLALRKKAAKDPLDSSWLASPLDTLARFLFRHGKPAEAETTRREAVERGDVRVLNYLTWRLATDPDSKLRDGPSAVVYGQKAAAITGRKDPNILDTLAAAYAEAGQFTNAVRVQQEAMVLQQGVQDKQIYASKVRLYQSNLPYRDPGSTVEKLNSLLLQGKSAEAEPLARECLALHEKLLPDDWQMFNTRAMLGASLLGQKKFAEAEPLLLAGFEGMKERESQIPPNATLRLVEAGGRLAQLYESTGETAKAAEWKERQALAQAGAQVASEAATRRASGDFHAQHGRWKEASADLSRLVELARADDYDEFKLTVLLVQLGDMAGYRAHCQNMVTRFGAANDPGPLDKTAKVCLLSAQQGFDLETSCGLADRAVTSGKDSIWLHYFQLVKGLAEYRAGHFASAIDWVSQSIGQPSEPSPDWNRDSAAYSVLAMAQHQLKHSDEAHAALAKAADIVNTKLPRLENGALDENWVDWLIAHILLREANALIESPPVARQE